MNPWNVGIDRTQLLLPALPNQPAQNGLDGKYGFDQTVQLQTITGQPAANWKLDCGDVCMADAIWFLRRVIKYPDTIRLEGWGPEYIGPSDSPAITSDMATFNGIHTTVYRPSTPAKLAHALWQNALNNKYAMYLRTGGNGQGHWCGMVQMFGGASSQPFDQLDRKDPWGGMILSQNFTDWASTLMRYNDGNYLCITFDQQPIDPTPDTRMG